jgi:hypothetical protein
MSVRRGIRVLCTVGAVACAWFAGTATAQVAVLTHTAEDREVLAQLGQLIDVPVREHGGSAPQSLALTLRETADWPEPYVVVIDRPNDSVHVLRPRDTTVVSRVLSASVMLDSQYAVALATAELLEWLGVLPAARGRPSEPSPPPAARPAAAIPHDEARAEGARSALGWAAGADLELATNPGFDVSLARPSVHAELQIGRGRDPVWFGFGARVGAPASWDRGLSSERFATGAERVEYSDFQTGLHAAIGLGAGRSAVFAQLEGGASFERIEAFSTSDRRVGDYAEVAGYLGLGLGLRYRLASALALAATVQGQWIAGRARYRIEDAPVLEEGPIRVATRIGLIWESALFP